MTKRIDKGHSSSLQYDTLTLSPVKPHIKLLSKKLPNDFFPNNQRMSSSTSLVRNLNRETILTSNFKRHTKNSVVRDTLTAKENNVKDEDLINSILKSARDIKRVLRRHSVELSRDKEERILNHETIQGRKIYDLELPPLMLKRGVTFS